MTYTMKIYPKPENAPDEAYFTREIFLSSCIRGISELAEVSKLLNNKNIDNKSEKTILLLLEANSKLFQSMISGVISEQIIFTNQEKETS